MRLSNYRREEVDVVEEERETRDASFMIRPNMSEKIGKTFPPAWTLPSSPSPPSVWLSFVLVHPSAVARPHPASQSDNQTK